jgi:hypothetical protein
LSPTTLKVTKAFRVGSDFIEDVADFAAIDVGYLAVGMNDNFVVTAEIVPRLNLVDGLSKLPPFNPQSVADMPGWGCPVCPKLPPLPLPGAPEAT